MVRELFHIQHGQAQQPLHIGNLGLVHASVATAAPKALSGFSASSARHRQGRLGWMIYSRAI
jgi:hypothetical protein